MFAKPLIWVLPGDANHPARHHPHQVVSYSEESSVGAPVAERNPKPLRAAQCDVNAELSRRTEHAEGEQVCGTASQGLEQGQNQGVKKFEKLFQLKLEKFIQIPLKHNPSHDQFFIAQHHQYTTWQ